MKSGTAVRIVYAIAVVAILVVAALPIISALPETKDSAFTAGTHSVYDLHLMDEDTLSANMSSAIGSSSGYTVEYGDAVESVDPSDLDALAARIIASGSSVAVLKDADGNVAVQDDIVYRNAVLFGYRMGMLVPEAMTRTLDMKVSLRFFSDDGRFSFYTEPFPNAIGSEITIGYTVPYVLYNLMGAYGCICGSRISADYAGIIDIDVRNMTRDLLYDPPLAYESTASSLIVRGGEGPSEGVGSVGAAKLEFSNDGTRVMKLSCEGDLYETLEGSMSDGRLKIGYAGTEYLMTEAETSALMDIVKTMGASV